MLTLSLQTTEPQAWVTIDPVLAKLATASHTQPWGRLYALKSRVVEPILQAAIALIKTHPVTIVLDAHPKVAAEPPLKEASAIASQAVPLAVACSARLVMTHHVFWQLPHAGHYNLRLIAQLQPDEGDERLSLFEIFNGDPDEVRDRKQDLKTQFEQALFLSFLGFHAEATCLFQDCANQCPGDTVARYYAQNQPLAPPPKTPPSSRPSSGVE